MADDVFAGPVACLVFEFPRAASVGDGLRAVLDRVDTGAIELLDLQCFTTDDAGGPVELPLTDLQPTTDLDLSAFDGVRSGVLDVDDRAAVVELLEPGWFAIAIVYEDRSLAAASARWAGVGGRELLSGGVTIDALAAAVDLED